MVSVVLKPGRDKSVQRRHPWIFSGAIAKVSGTPEPGETVEVRGSNNAFLAFGACSPVSQIRVRIWTFNSDEEISPSFFYSRLKCAIQSRNLLTSRYKLTAYRLVNAESDGLPGLIVDRYNNFLVCQFTATGVEHWKQDIVKHLGELVPNDGIYERSNTNEREKEGLSPSSGVLSGAEPPDYVEIEEGACRFLVDIRRGQKTGFYLDQRDSRACLAEYAQDAEVLNCFAYTGSFAIWALKGGASGVINVESSASCLKLAERNAELNGFGMSKIQNVEGDVFDVLRQYRDSRRSFDIIILDPPQFVGSRLQLARASRGYKDINLLALKLLKPGGLLFTFSCSARMPQDLFSKIVADAALDAGRYAQIIRRLTQASDHPTALNFPEGNYLKGLVCRCVDCSGTYMTLPPLSSI